jgi:glycosyltransferase involved in cell wall biosynthesis
MNNDIKDKNLVSIIMPAYKCGRFIEESIKSVQEQTYQNWELIIVDDCSGDGTIDLVLGYKKHDDRINIFQNASNSGAAVSRNTALQKAKGRWIAFLDSDDLWEPEKLEKQIKFMEENDYAFSYHDYVEINEEDKELGVYVSGKKRVGKFDMFACCWPGCLSVMYDASKIGLVQINDIKKNNDTALWLKVVRKADCYLLKECLGRYRRRANSITPKPLWQRIWAHYPLFRVGEEMSPIRATFWVFMNVFGNAYKKFRYVKKYKVER